MMETVQHFNTVCNVKFSFHHGGTNECINSQKSNDIYLLQTATLLLKIVCTQEKQ